MIATGLMLFIVFLGIFGVLTLALSKRIREIAVRRVLGAELHHILTLFIRQYAWLLLIANLIAWPIAYYFTNRWYVFNRRIVYFCDGRNPYKSAMHESRICQPDKEFEGTVV